MVSLRLKMIVLKHCQIRVNVVNLHNIKYCTTDDEQYNNKQYKQYKHYKLYKLNISNNINNINNMNNINNILNNINE